MVCVLAMTVVKSMQHKQQMAAKLTLGQELAAEAAVETILNQC